jgi:hypothetical protein
VDFDFERMVSAPESSGFWSGTNGFGFGIEWIQETKRVDSRAEWGDSAAARLDSGFG